MTGNTRHIRIWQYVSLALAVLLAGSVLIFGSLVLVKNSQLNSSVARLSSEITHLQQQQTMPTALLTHYRDSICYVYASYAIDRPASLQGPKRLHLAVSGTGFVVSDRLIATNKHVFQSDLSRPEATRYLNAGARPRLEKLLAFFPGLARPVVLHGIEYSRTADLAVARFELPPGIAPIAPLPLSSANSEPGDAIVVVGYPLGAAGMIAKSPEPVYQRLAFSSDTIDIVKNLAALSLIRPSSTYGHLGDIVGDKLIYDAPTAHGGSGGPVLNTRGEVVAVNSAYMNGFAGGTIGFSVNALKPLIARAQYR